MDEKIKLFNGDSVELFEKIISNNNEQNIILVSDPPFNINYKYDKYKDKMAEEDYYLMLKYFFSSFPSVVIHYPEQLYKLSFKMGKIPEKVISWVYNSNTAKQHRDIGFFGIKPDMKKVKQPYKNPNDKRIKQRMKKGIMGGRLYDWWNVNQVKNVSKEKTSHPCQMPLKVMKNIIGILPDDCLIIDPFMGTGTTGIAVIEMNKEQGVNRKFIGIELSKDYFDIATKRIENYFTGKEK